MLAHDVTAIRDRRPLTSNLSTPALGFAQSKTGHAPATKARLWRRGMQVPCQADARFKTTLRMEVGAFEVGGPIEKRAEAAAVRPEEAEEVPGGLTGRDGLGTEERFQSPGQIGAAPGAEAIAAGDAPVVSQGVEHRCFNLDGR